MKNSDYVGFGEESLIKTNTNAYCVTLSQLEEQLRIEATIEELTIKAQIYYLRAKQIERQGSRIITMGRETRDFGTDSIEIQ